MPRFNLAAAAIPFWFGWRRQIVAQALSIVLYIWLWWSFANWIGRTFPVNRTVEVLLTFLLPYLILGIVQGVFAQRLVKEPGSTSWIAAIATPILTIAAFLLVWKVLPGTDYHYKDFVQETEDDLRDLRAAQERHFAATGSYATAADSLKVWTSSMVSLQMGAASRTGWNASARHLYLPAYACGIHVGSAPPLIRGARPGEPKCVNYGP